MKTVVLHGVTCVVSREKRPDGAWYNAYRFQVPGWEECIVVGKRAAERVIRGRLDKAVRNTMGIL